MIVEMHREHEKKKAAYLPKSDLFDNWLPIVDSFRTFIIFPSDEIQAAFLAGEF
jgi:hypothetical protein